MWAFVGNIKVRLEGFEPPTPGLGKRDDALQQIAEVCEFSIAKPFSLLPLAACCRVLRSRWCQSGVRIADVYAPCYPATLSDWRSCFAACPAPAGNTWFCGFSAPHGSSQGNPEPDT
jgi:hypothetical protein